MRLVHMADDLPGFRGSMILTTGSDPDNLRLDAWLPAFYTWCEQTVRAGADPKKKGDDNRRWREFRDSLWKGVEREPKDTRQAFAQAQSALQQLGALRG